MKTSKLGDEMPPRRNVKWGSFENNEGHLSDEWHDMTPTSGHMSEKWVEQHPTTGHMSDRWEEVATGGTEFSDKWHELKQDSRRDPYSMAPSEGDREEASMKNQSSNTMKNSRHGRYEIRGSEGQSGKGL